MKLLLVSLPWKNKCVKEEDFCSEKEDFIDVQDLF
jgi:hypothetical protein